MPPAISMLPGALLTAGACVAGGSLLLRVAGFKLSRSERLLLAFVPGAACLSLLMLVPEWLGWHQPVVAASVEVTLIGLWLWLRRPESGGATRERVPVAWNVTFAGGFAVFGLLYVSRALSPGCLAVPLTAAAADLEAGFPRGVEMVLGAASALGGPAAAALVRATFLLILPWLVLGYARRCGMPKAGVFGALLAFASPAVGIEGSGATAVIALATTLFTLFYLLQVWSRERTKPAAPVVIGLVAGFAGAASYSGWLAIIYAAGFIVWKLARTGDFRGRPGLSTVAGALLVSGPWLAGNWIVRGNPVSPFLNNLFPNPYVAERAERSYIAGQRMYTEVKGAAEVPLQATILGGTLGAPAGPVFLAAPLATLALGSAPGRALLVAASVLGASYPLNIGIRFLVPVLPFVALAMGMAVAQTRVLAPALLAAHLVLSIPAVTRRYSDPGTPVISGSVFRPLLHPVPETKPPGLLDACAPGARIFALSPGPDSEGHAVIVAGRGSPNDLLADILRSPLRAERRPTLCREFHFAPRRARAIRVTTGVGAAVEWRVAEMRLFLRGREIPRPASWRVRASDNPWHVQAAFDNTTATWWAAMLETRPGMRLELTSAEDIELDGVELECSPDQQAIGLGLELAAAPGEWRKIADHTEDRDALPPRGMRRAAIEELRARGVGYILIADSDFGAEDFPARAGLWGFTEIRRGNGRTLYKLR
jgi:hypothetical protein